MFVSWIQGAKNFMMFYYDFTYVFTLKAWLWRKNRLLNTYSGQARRTLCNNTVRMSVFIRMKEKKILL